MEERAAFVEGACGNDESVRAEVESLLAADADAGSFLDQPAVRGPESPAAEDTLAGATIERDWRVARAWLSRDLRKGDTAPIRRPDDASRTEEAAGENCRGRI